MTAIQPCRRRAINAARVQTEERKDEAPALPVKRAKVRGKLRLADVEQEA